MQRKPDSKGHDYKKVNEQPIIDPVQACIAAAKDGYLEKLKPYIESNQVDKDVIDPITKRGLLHWAADGGHLEVAEYLISKKADVDIRGYINGVGSGWPSENGTPLHVAVTKRRVEMVRFLLDNKAGINKRNHSGKTPLHLLEYAYCPSYGHPIYGNEKEIREITQLLIDRGADLSVPIGKKNVIEYLSSRGIVSPAAEVIDEHYRQEKAKLAEHKKEKKDKKERKAAAFSLLPPPRAPIP